MRKILVLILWLSCAMALTSNAFAQEKLWAGILVATNQPRDRAQPLPPALKPYRERITRFFGYRFFKVLNQGTLSLSAANRHLSVPTKHVLLNVESQSIVTAKSRKHYRLQFAVFEEKKLLVRASARVSRESPLLIRGPLCGRGQLLIVMLVK